MTKKPYYITTPIYYPSTKLHIGNTYTTVAADALARFKRLNGYDVMFLTGTDEHGQKIQRIAEEKGITPKEHVDEIVAGIKELWKMMDINYDKFIRTTDDYHKATVQKIFKQLYDQGDIYKSRQFGGEFGIAGGAQHLPRGRKLQARGDQGSAGGHGQNLPRSENQGLRCHAAPAPGRLGSLTQAPPGADEDCGKVPMPRHWRAEAIARPGNGKCGEVDTKSK